LPTVQFGPGMTSATEIRAKWPAMTPEQKIKLVQQLYPDTQQKEAMVGVIVKIFDEVMGSGVEETLVGAATGSGALNPTRVSMSNGPDSGVEEAVLVNDPNEGHLIVPDGGLGTWDEKSLVSNLARKFASMLDMLKSGEYARLHSVLRKGQVVDSMLTALAQYERFMQQQGQRPIARGREIDLAQTGMAEDYVEERKKK
jgi:hypothetical protein